jgi:DNA helicase-2/ATP-dependent DNA helicase PcrA
MAKASAKQKASEATEFDHRYKDLNPEQREAVDALEGPVMVIAGPGTGKTTVLTLRIANILGSTKTKPERILALTFTESGAIEMRRKLAELVGQDAYRVEISTFHGFANRIIQDYPDHFPEIVGASPITEIDQVDIVRRLLNTATLKLAKLRPFGDPYFYLRDIIRALTELKQQSVSPEMFAKIAEDDRARFYANPDLVHTSGKYEGKMKGKYDSGAKKIEKNLELVRVYEAYQSELRKAKQYDYADMIMFTALALENDGDLRRALQSAYDYFLVDEHQDTNDAQNKIVELLVDEGGAQYAPRNTGPNLFVVGDEKQAIFRFQGASLENFHYFRTRYKNVKLITLRSNYRSTQAILNAAQAVSPREKELVSESGHKELPGGGANFAVLSTPDVEHFFIAQKIQEIIKKTSTAPEEVAVLYRDNKEAAPLARMLERLHVPFNIESDQDVLGDPEIRKLVRVLRAVQHFGNDIWLAEALHADFLGVAPMDAYRIMAFAGRMRRKAYSDPEGRKVTIYDVLASAELQKEAGVVSKESVTAATTFAHNLQEWKRAAENDGAVEAFEKIVRDSGYLAAILRHPSGSEKLAKLHALFDLLKSFTERDRRYTLHDFFAYLDLMEEHGVAVKAKDSTVRAGRVRLMTAHKSKGREFDYVFIMNATDRTWGSRFHRESLTLPKGIYRMVKDAEAEVGIDSNNDESEDANDVKDDADERNVFYVALTRARKELFLTMAKTDREGKERLPTQFVSEMKPEILTPLDTEPYEKEFDERRAEVEFGQQSSKEGGKNGAPAEKKPELMDKEFLNALFNEQGISVTALNNYLECPWHYFYVNLLRIPEAENKYSAFGTAIHAALKSYFDEFDKGSDLGKEYLVRRFEEAMARASIPEHEYEETLAKGRKVLPAFYDEYHGEWVASHAKGAAAQSGTAMAMNELRIDGVAVGDVPVNGKLDRVEILQNGTSAKVSDYKTGRVKSRNEIEGKTKDADGNHKRQLVFYKLLLGKQGKYDMTEGVILFVEPDERGKSHREAFDITPGEVAVLEKLVLDVAGEIRGLAFWNKGCKQADCEYCKLREGMG